MLLLQTLSNQNTENLYKVQKNLFLKSGRDFFGSDNFALYIVKVKEKCYTVNVFWKIRYVTVSEFAWIIYHMEGRKHVRSVRDTQRKSGAVR